MKTTWIDFQRSGAGISVPFARIGRSVAMLLLLGLALGSAPGLLHAARYSSKFTYTPPRIDGKVEWGEWAQAEVWPVGTDGFIAMLNDACRLYLLIDVRAQDKDDPDDQLMVSFDTDRNGQITSGVDLNYRMLSETRSLRYQQYLGPGEWAPLKPQTSSAAAVRFGAFAGDGSVRLEQTRLVREPHRVWELAIDLGEINAKAGGETRLGLLAQSPATDIRLEPVPEFTHSFSELVEVALAPGSVLRPLADPDATFAFEAVPIEVTQAIQDRLNSLPLVANKPTVVRVYVTASGASWSQPVTVYLYGRRDGVDLPGSPLSKPGSAPLTIDRENLLTTPYFELPASWISGTVQFEVRVRDWYDRVTVSALTDVTFTPKETPTIWVIPINTGSASSPVLVSESVIAANENYLE